MSSQRLGTQRINRPCLTRANLQKSYGLEVQTGLLRKRLAVESGMQPANKRDYEQKANVKKRATQKVFSGSSNRGVRWEKAVVNNL
jgi:hypothetical protein